MLTFDETADSVVLSLGPEAGFRVEFARVLVVVTSAVSLARAVVSLVPASALESWHIPLVGPDTGLVTTPVLVGEDGLGCVAVLDAHICPGVDCFDGNVAAVGWNSEAVTSTQVFLHRHYMFVAFAVDDQFVDDVVSIGTDLVDCRNSFQEP